MDEESYRAHALITSFVRETNDQVRDGHDVHARRLNVGSFLGIHHLPQVPDVIINVFGLGEFVESGSAP